MSERISCWTVVCQSLIDHGTDDSSTTSNNSLASLLVAVLFLYLMDGFMEGVQEHASTREHYRGTLAILESLGGFLQIRSTSSLEISMLLSEFASTDLTDEYCTAGRHSSLQQSGTTWKHHQFGGRLLDATQAPWDQCSKLWQSSVCGFIKMMKAGSRMNWCLLLSGHCSQHTWYLEPSATSTFSTHLGPTAYQNPIDKI